jgi:hypothetical protein
MYVGGTRTDSGRHGTDSLKCHPCQGKVAMLALLLQDRK